MRNYKTVYRYSNQEYTEPSMSDSMLTFLCETKVGRWVAKIWAHCLFISRLTGWVWSRGYTRKYIPSFIKKFHIPVHEVAQPIEEFSSLNAFFSRKLKPSSRPLAEGKDVCLAPADGTYLVFPDISQLTGIPVKSRLFSLEELLGDTHLAQEYHQGSMVIARLAIFDYHRFHFPMDCIPSQDRCIRGALFSVHPKFIKGDFSLFAENKRKITELQTSIGTVLYIEVGALNVGSIVQTFAPGRPAARGEEKGFFQIGGSTVILLFPKNTIDFDADLLQNTEAGYETRCLMGQSIGRMKAT